MSVGIDWTSKRAASSGSSSVFTLAKRMSGWLLAVRWKTGAKRWHGPHQLAQKSTRTIPPADTVWTKLFFVSAARRTAPPIPRCRSSRYTKISGTTWGRPQPRRDKGRWRRDLNPRRGCPLTRFRGVLLRPLGHTTVEYRLGDEPGALRRARRLRAGGRLRAAPDGGRPDHRAEHPAARRAGTRRGRVLHRPAGPLRPAGRLRRARGGDGDGGALHPGRPAPRARADHPDRQRPSQDRRAHHRRGAPADLLHHGGGRPGHGRRRRSRRLTAPTRRSRG